MTESVGEIHTPLGTAGRDREGQAEVLSLLLSYRDRNTQGILKGFYKGSIVGFYRAHYTIISCKEPPQNSVGTLSDPFKGTL